MTMTLDSGQLMCFLNPDRSNRVCWCGTFVTEVCEVRTPQQRYAFKLYHHGGWSTEEIAWEAELVDHLASNGIPVAKVVPLLFGDQVGEVAAPEGPRPFLLSEWVEGRKPRASYTEVRPVGAVNVAALPWLQVVKLIGNLSFHLADKAAWRGTKSLGEGWVEECLADLQKSAEQLL